MSVVWSWVRGLLRLNAPANENNESGADGNAAARCRRSKRKRDDGHSQISKATTLAASSMRTRSQARSEAMSSLFALILLPLVNTGYIQAVEVGRLAQVCKVLNLSSQQDDIWAAFCSREYPCTKDFTLSFKNNMGHRWLYRRWTLPVVKRRRVEELPPLRPPSCLPSNIFFLLHVSYNGVPVLSMMKRMGSLLVNGHYRKDLDDPIILGKATWWHSVGAANMYYDMGRNSPVTCDGFDDADINISLHMLRDFEKDCTMCCLFRSNDREEAERVPAFVSPSLEEEGDRITNSTGFDFSEEQDSGFLRYETPVNDGDHLCLRSSRQAKRILRRLPYPIFFDVEMNFRVVDGGSFAITAVDVAANKFSMVDGCSSFDSREEHDKCGVTLLHVLSELE